MVYSGLIEGKYVNLRSVDEKDAEFTLSLRQDPNLTKYLPKLNITIEEQVAWIKKQKEKEDDYYFVIEDKKGEKKGVIGIYDIKDNCAETGRIAVIGNAIESIEAQLLSFDFAFDYLKLDYTVNYVMAENSHALRFSQMFGSISSEPYLDGDGKMRIDGKINRDSYQNAKKRIIKMIYR